MRFSVGAESSLIRVVISSSDLLESSVSSFTASSFNSSTNSCILDTSSPREIISLLDFASSEARGCVCVIHDG